MKSIISKKSITNEQKLSDLLSNTILEGECMIWTRALNTDGYARMAGNIKVHRLVNKLSTGEDNHGKVVRHTCDNPKCINPNHLIVGTHLENIMDRDLRNRTYKKITKEVVTKVKALLNLNSFTQKEIAILIGIDPRRVSDIKRNIYSDEGKFLRNG